MTSQQPAAADRSRIRRTATEPGEVWTLFDTSFRELQSARPDVAEALQTAMSDRLASPSES